MSRPGSPYADDRAGVVAAEPGDVWQVIERLGGDNGWYSFPLAWQLRGLLDRLVGGVGLRRGRRDPVRLRAGDPLDFWRVEQVVPGRLLVLRAEMALPGTAHLELSVERRAGRTLLRQRATFQPHGPAGHAYWWSVAPMHGAVFGAMVRNIGRAAERGARQRAPVEGGRS